MIATTWNDVHRMISNATCRLFSDEVPILLRMPDGGTMRMVVKDANVVPARDGYALLIELCDPESEKTSRFPLDTDGGDMIQCGAKS